MAIFPLLVFSSILFSDWIPEALCPAGLMQSSNCMAFVGLDLDPFVSTCSWENDHGVGYGIKQ